MLLPQLQKEYSLANTGRMGNLLIQIESSLSQL